MIGGKLSMKSNFTHKFDLEIGLDLTKILAPESIPGVKAFLGVESDSDLLEAVAADKYEKIRKALASAGFDIIKAQFSNMNQVEDWSVLKDDESADKENTEVKNSTDKKLDLDTFKKFLSNVLKDANDSIEADNGEMVKVDIDASYIDISPDFETLYKETGINSDVEFGFDELDANQVAVITYNDKEQMMKFKIIDKELMENKEEPNAKG